MPLQGVLFGMGRGSRADNTMKDTINLNKKNRLGKTAYKIIRDTITGRFVKNRYILIMILLTSKRDRTGLFRTRQQAEIESQPTTQCREYRRKAVYHPYRLLHHPYYFRRHNRVNRYRQNPST